MTVEQEQHSEPLLLEVGVEEMPARFLAGAERSLGERLSEALQNLRLQPPATQPIKTFSTPRRLVVRVPKVLLRQPNEVDEVVGPPVKVAFDAEGKPTRAAESFAERNSTSVKRLIRIETPKGTYLGFRKRTRGRLAREILAETLPQVILGISFPKSMYWTGKAGPRFIRPIRWLLAILAEGEKARIIPFEIAGVASRRSTYGHRVTGPKAIPVRSFDEYVERLHERQVELDPQARSEIIRSGIKAILEGQDFKLVRDEELHDWVINSTEWPRPIMGEFDRRFLHLSREILVTVMRDHQKYFAVEDDAGAVQPNFITVMNLDDDPSGIIRGGHQRVLAARFADAEFFWKADQRLPLGERQGMLGKVTYQAKLGSYAAKVERMEAVAEGVCADLEAQGKLESVTRDLVLRAVRLCKCDLTTQMVREFTELQGVVGGLYAHVQGESDVVADAIYDHYKPANVRDECPRSKVGAIVSLADRIDSVVAGFAVGLAPTGSSDPFGLRRAGNGIIRIAVESLETLDLARVIAKAVLFAEHTLPESKEGSLGLRVENFLRDRMEFYLRDVAGVRYDTVRAVLSPTVLVGSGIPAAVLARAQALEEVRDTEDFLALAAAAKRTRNILTKSAGINHADAGVAVDIGLLSEAPERELYTAYDGLRRNLESLEREGDYARSFRTMALIRPQVDLFFDKVLVMAEDPAVRENRLRLLIQLSREVFSRLADLSEVAAEAHSPSGPQR